MLFHGNCMCVGAGRWEEERVRENRREGGRERRSAASCVVNVWEGESVWM